MATRFGNSYIPERGDLVWLSFDPQAGREQAGRRPAVILSPSSYNRTSGLAIAAPITSQIKGYPFEVLIPPTVRIGGVVLVDHLKSIDWRARNAERIGNLPPEIVNRVLKLAGLLITPATH